MMSCNFPVPSWLHDIGGGLLVELTLLTQQMPLPLILCAYMPKDTEVLEPLWSQCVDLTSAEITRVGFEQVASTLGSSSVAVKDLARDGDLKRQAITVMIAVIDRFKELMSSLSWEDAQSISQLSSLTPSLVSEINDESLIVLGDKIQADYRGFKSDGRIVPYHDKISQNRELIPVLLDLAKDKKCKVAIAPNYLKSILESEYVEMILADHAFGKPYSRDDLSDPNSTGRTVHTAPLTSEQAKMTYWKCLIQNLKRVEFMWTCKEGLKTFQTEEICSKDQWRYLHAMYSIELESFIHLDGAWMDYESDLAEERRKPDARFGRPKAKVKTKLFRIDGEFNVEQFSDLTTLFFRNNPLVAEYFDGHTGPTVETSEV